MPETSALQSGYDVVLNKVTDTAAVQYTAQSGVDIVIDRITTTVKPKRYTIELGTGGSTGAGGENLQSGVWTYLNSFGNLNTVADKQGYISFLLDNVKPQNSRIIISRYDSKGIDHIAGLTYLYFSDNCHVEWNPEDDGYPQTSRVLVRGEVAEHGTGEDLYVSFRCVTPEGSFFPLSQPLPDEGTDIRVAWDYTSSWHEDTFFIGKSADFPSPGVIYINADPLMLPGDVSSVTISELDMTGHEAELGQVIPGTKLSFTKLNGEIAVQMVAIGSPVAQNQTVFPFDKSYRVPVSVEACYSWWSGTKAAKLQIWVISNSEGGGEPGGGTGGTLILDGSGYPDDSLGVPDNYYLDTSGHVLYGPKSVPVVATPEPVALLANRTPMEVESPSYATTSGNEIQYLADGQITALRMFAFGELLWEDGIPLVTDPMRLTLWDESTVLVAEAYVERNAFVGWVEAPLATPIDVTTGQKFRVAMDFTEYDYGGFIVTDFPVEGETTELATYGNMSATGVVGTEEGLGFGYPDQITLDNPILLTIDTVFDSNFIPTTLFTTHAKPNDSASGGPTSGGLRLQFQADGQVTALRYYRSPDSGNIVPTNLHLWSDSGILIATAAPTVDGTSGWKEATLAFPINVITGQIVRVSADFIDNEYISYDEYWFSEMPGEGVKMENAHMQALSGCYRDSSDLGFPNDYSSDLVYTDVVFSQAIGAWPVAVVSDTGGAVVGSGDIPLPFQPYTRTINTYATASLAAGTSENNGSIALAPGYRLFRIGTFAPSRVRFYYSAAQRDADADRPIGTAPTGDHGCVLDFVATPEMLEIDLIPAVDGYDGKASPDGNIPINVTNLDVSYQLVQVNLTWIRTE